LGLISSTVAAEGYLLPPASGALCTEA
jgi:hypothetical protein